MSKCGHADNGENIKKLHRNRQDGGDPIPFYKCEVCGATWV